MVRRARGRLRLEPNPALAREAQERARSLQNRIVDRITAFAGSMAFVYIHIVWFSCWIVFGVEHYPFGLLTLIVSLEAIFLSTFVMISQNRADAKRRLIADQQWQTVQAENEQNEELLGLSRQILELTNAIHDESRTEATAAIPARRPEKETEMNHGSIFKAFAPFRRSRTNPPALDETKLSPAERRFVDDNVEGHTWTRWFRGCSEAAIRTAFSTFRRRGEDGAGDRKRDRTAAW